MSKLSNQTLLEQAAKGFFNLLGDKLLAYTAGCHDNNWTVDQIDYDQVAEMSNSPYMGNGGTINLIIKEQLYRIAVRQVWWIWFVNICCKQAISIKKSDSTADIVAIGHHHVSGSSIRSISR